MTPRIASAVASWRVGRGPVGKPLIVALAVVATLLLVAAPVSALRIKVAESKQITQVKMGTVVLGLVDSDTREVRDHARSMPRMVAMAQVPGGGKAEMREQLLSDYAEALTVLMGLPPRLSPSQAARMMAAVRSQSGGLLSGDSAELARLTAAESAEIAGLLSADSSEAARLLGADIDDVGPEARAVIAAWQPYGRQCVAVLDRTYPSPAAFRKELRVLADVEKRGDSSHRQLGTCRGSVQRTQERRGDPADRAEIRREEDRRHRTRHGRPARRGDQQHTVSPSACRQVTA